MSPRVAAVIGAIAAVLALAFTFQVASMDHARTVLVLPAAAAPTTTSLVTTTTRSPTPKPAPAPRRVGAKHVG